MTNLLQAFLPGLQKAVFSLGLHIVFPPFVFVPKFPLLVRNNHNGSRAHPF